MEVSMHCWVQVIERIARESPAVALMILISAIGSDALVFSGSAEQQRAILPALAAGEAKICFALTEPNAGSDISAISTTALPDGDGYTINGGKIFITNGAVGDWFTVFARVVEDGSIQFHPERWKQVYLDWLDNLKDWCISRQLWWGHRIPMFYCDECGWEDASVEDVETCPVCGKPVRQDEDVLDTWFSSQLWPFATMGWTEEGMDAPQMKQAVSHPGAVHGSRHHGLVGGAHW